MLRSSLTGLLFFVLTGCTSPGKQLTNETLTAACAMCVLKMENATSCYWAVEIDGEFYPATGPAIPLDHKSHAPDGMCSMKRTVIVDGNLKNGQLWATRFDLIPVTTLPDNSQVKKHKHKH